MPVLDDNAGEWLQNLIDCYAVQYLPEYRHIFKVRPQTLRMDIIRKICESKERHGMATSTKEKMAKWLWRYVEEFRMFVHCTAQIQTH